jgi:DNA polymerase III epsilon subunit family exonuclease
LDEQRLEAEAETETAPSSEDSRRSHRGGQRLHPRDSHRSSQHGHDKRRSSTPPSRGKTKHLHVALDQGSYIAFDIETTGGNPEKNGITEIFALRYRDGKIHDTFYSMVNPGVPIPPIVRRMTGITDKMVRDAPPIKAIMPDFIRFIADDVLVSHNTIGDMKFLRYFAEVECAHAIENYFLCTHLLVEKLAPAAPDKSLKGLATHFALPGDARLHRAEADAYLTLELFKILLGKMHERGIPSIADAIRFQGDFESGLRLGFGVRPEILKVLPEGHGVFFLRDYSGQVTFLSSAHNIAREVRRLQKLSALPKQLLRSVLSSCDLTFEETPTAFAASLLEARSLVQNRIRFDPTNWHQRTANFIFLAREADEYRLSTGPLVEGVMAYLGPVRGGKEVTVLLDQLANIVGRKPTKKGLKLTLDEGRVLSDFFKRRRLKASLKEKVLRLFPKHSERIDYLDRLRGLLKNVVIPNDLFDGRIMSGALAAQVSGGWLVYSVADGQVIAEDKIEGDLERGLSEGKLAAKLHRQIRSNMRSREETEEQGLSLGDANLLNRLFWWSFFGSRSEAIRILHVDELARW